MKLFQVFSFPKSYGESWKRVVSILGKQGAGGDHRSGRGESHGQAVSIVLEQTVLLQPTSAERPRMANLGNTLPASQCAPPGRGGESSYPDRHVQWSHRSILRPDSERNLYYLPKFKWGTRTTLSRFREGLERSKH